MASTVSPDPRPRNDHTSPAQRCNTATLNDSASAPDLATERSRRLRAVAHTPRSLLVGCESLRGSG